MNTENDKATSERKLVWRQGELEGLYVDLDNQLIGFRDNEPVHVEYKKIQVLSFLMEHSDSYVTPAVINAIEELNSVDLSKNISAIKNIFIKVLSASYDKSTCTQLYDQIIKKQKIRNSMGYRLIVPEEEQKEEVVFEVKTIPAPPVQQVRTVQEPQGDIGILKTREERFIKRSEYLKANWFPLFLMFCIIIACYLVCSSSSLTVTDLFVSFTRLSPLKLFFILAVASLIPVMSGVIIDTPVSLLRYKALHPGYSPSLIEISKTKAGGFDISSDHVRFFFLCNLSGALSTMCIIHYASTLEGFSEFMNSGNLNTIAVLIMILGVFISLYNNYSLQTDPDDIRNGHNYLLSRVHAFTNTIYLSFSTGISAFIMFCMIYYSIKTYNTEMTRFNSAFCAMTLSAYAFLWFTADSPLATDLNSISNKNFLAGTPFLMAFTMIYTAVFFEPVTACFFTIATTVVVGIVWVLYVIHRKSTKFIKPSRSFFAIFTVLVLIMMLFKVFS